MKDYPGIDHRLIICDVCGFKFRVKDVTKVVDRYNPQNNMIVCHEDLDKLNPQFIPFKLPLEKLLTNPSMVRPEAEQLNYASNPLADQLPSAPRNLVANLDPLNNQIYLTWDGPLNVGSSPLLGYIITRAEPQQAYYFTIESNTNSPAAYYLDTSADVNSEYTYKIAAISNLGTGSYSNIAFWPIEVTAHNYLITSDTLQTITTGSGAAIYL